MSAINNEPDHIVQVVVEHKHAETFRIVGMGIIAIGGLVAISLAIWSTGEQKPLWAIFLLVWCVHALYKGKSSYSAPYNPLIQAIIAGTCFLLIGLICFFLRNGSPLWAIILVGWMLSLNNYRVSPRT